MVIVEVYVPSSEFWGISSSVWSSLMFTRARQVFVPVRIVVSVVEEVNAYPVLMSEKSE